MIEVLLVFVLLGVLLTIIPRSENAQGLIGGIMIVVGIPCFLLGLPHCEWLIGVGLLFWLDDMPFAKEFKNQPRWDPVFGYGLIRDEPLEPPTTVRIKLDERSHTYQRIDSNPTPLVG